jgi:hypothetical protein
MNLEGPDENPKCKKHYASLKTLPRKSNVIKPWWKKKVYKDKNKYSNINIKSNKTNIKRVI